ncbi:MAG: YbaY family lipoprotein [Opitutus sp.]|nr:YbaY family lipoprotein [Opitutus sp.]
MKAFLFSLLLLGLWASAGCGHLDLAATNDAERVLTGFVTNPNGGELPPDTEVTIRIVDYSRGEERGETLGEQVIQNPGRFPVPIRIEYRAEDAVLMRRVNVEARISVGGRLRYATGSGHPITLHNVNDSHFVQVDLVGRR